MQRMKNKMPCFLLSSQGRAHSGRQGKTFTQTLLHTLNSWLNRRCPDPSLPLFIILSLGYISWMLSRKLSAECSFYTQINFWGAASHCFLRRRKQCKKERKKDYLWIVICAAFKQAPTHKALGVSAFFFAQCASERASELHLLKWRLDIHEGEIMMAVQ